MRLSTLDVLSIEELQTVHEASLRILADVGIYLEGEELRDLAISAGARLDREQGVVRFPPDVILAALRSLPAQVVLANRDGTPALTLGDGRTYFGCGCDAIYFQDGETGERRPATKEDVGNLIRIGDALDRIAVVAPPAIPQDVPPQACHAHAADAVFNNSTKHLFTPPGTTEAAETIIRMARVVAGTSDLGSKPIVTCMVSIQSPLRWPEDLGESVLAIVRSGAPIMFHTAPLPGASAPLTLAGMLALYNAEVLSGITIAQLIRPGAPVIYGGGWGTFSLRQMTRVLGCPEGALLRLAGGQLARFYHLPCHSLGPDSDSQVLDEQNGWEKMLTTVFSLLGGQDLVINASMYASGMTVSYEQLVLDQEMLEIGFRLLEGITVSPETLALEVIERAAPRGDFLTDEHTLKHLRSGEHYQPTLSSRYSHDQWLEAGGRDVVRRAKERAQQILSTHRPIPLEEPIQRELKAILAAAGR